MKILHIGFGKTATTSLQKVVFPELCNHFGMSYIGSQDDRIKKHLALLELGKEVALGNDFNNTLISSEGLCSWDPYFWEEWANKNAQNFGRDSHVLLVIREPKSYLKSIYLQRCFHEGNVMSPQYFFLTKNIYSPLLSSAKFSIEDFSYQKIIDIYAERFDNLTVAKYESIPSLSAIKQMFEKNSMHYDKWHKLSDTFSRCQSNPSYTHSAVKLTFAMNKFLNFLGFSIASSDLLSSQNYLNALEVSHGCTEKFSGKAGRKLYKRIFLRVARAISWRSLMTKVVPKFSNKNFCWNASNIEGLNIDKLSEEYESIRPITHFNKGFVVNE